jgi:hypothetical protein
MKHGIAIALFAGVFLVAAPALGADGLAPGSLAAPADAPADTPADVPALDAPDDAAALCDNCPPPRKYDSRETIKTRRDLHRTIKTINTYEVAPAAPVKESGRIRVRSDVTLVNFVVHRYRVIYAPALASASEEAERPAPALYRPSRICRYGRHGRYGSCRPPLRVRG